MALEFPCPQGEASLPGECQRCGKPIAEGASFCNACGQKDSQDGVSSASSGEYPTDKRSLCSTDQTGQDSRRKIRWIVGLILGLTLAGVATILLVTQSRSRPEEVALSEPEQAAKKLIQVLHHDPPDGELLVGILSDRYIDEADEAAGEFLRELPELSSSQTDEQLETLFEYMGMDISLQEILAMDSRELIVRLLEGSAGPFLSGNFDSIEFVSCETTHQDATVQISLVGASGDVCPHYTIYLVEEAGEWKVDDWNGYDNE